MKYLGWLLLNALLSVTLLFPSPALSDEHRLSHRTFVDTSGELTLADILSNRYANRFAPTPEEDLRLPQAPGALWLQVPVDEHASVLTIDNPLISQVAVHQVGPDSIVSHRAGAKRPTGAAQLPFPGFAFALDESKPTPAHMVYVRLAHSYPVNVHVGLDDTRGVALTHGWHQAIQGALAGLLLSLVMHGLLQGLLGRDPLHLYLAVAGLLVAMSVLIRVDWLEHLWPDLPASFRESLQLLALASIGLLLTRLFLSERRLRVQADIVIAATTLLALGALTAWPVIAEPLVDAARLALPTLAIVVTAYFWYNRAPFSKPLFCGHLLLVVSWLVDRSQLPHSLAEQLAGLLAWAALVAYAWLLLDRQKHRIARSLQQRQAEATAQAETRTKTEFLTRISHEIRTPMNGVLGMTELLLDTALSAKQRDFVQTIHSSGNDLLNLVNEVLDMSRLESGQLVLEHLQFDLHALINDCLDIFRGRADSQAIELIGFVHPDVPRTVTGDPTRLRQVLLNLLSTSLQSTAQGEIVLVVGRETSSRGEPLLRFAVQDTGTGLSPEARAVLTGATLNTARIFDNASATSFLGLVIARQLTTMMGGQLGVKYASDQGTTVWMTLPDTAIDTATAPDPSGTCLVDRTVLIVDDNATCRKVLQQQVSAWGMQPYTASSGKEALAILRTQASLASPIDVLLVDQSMPGMTGLELASRIHDDPSVGGDLLIIMLTGVNQVPNRIVARNAGIRRILSKPVAGYTLRATLVDEWSGQQSRQAKQPEPTVETEAPPADSTFRVLVAEDNAISTKVIRGMLQKLKVDSHAVANGREAVEAARNGLFDLILMDCEMPELDGFTAAEQIRNWEQSNGLHAVPIIALTAHILPEHRERARKAGMNGHMAKPIDLIQLREQLAFWTERKANGTVTP